MALWGDRKGAWTANGASIPATINMALSTGSSTIAIGDLIVVVVGEQTSLTVTSVTDTLGNTYSAVNAGTVGGNVSGRCFYSRVTVAGTNTQITASATASADNFSAVAASYTGPFAVSPLDVAPANNANTDNTSPFTCPATGSLAQIPELVAVWMVAQASATYSATAPNLKDIQDAGVGGLATTILGSQVVSVTTTISPEFTGTNPTSSVQGTASFKADRANFVGIGYYTSDQILPPKGPEFPLSLRTWLQANTGLRTPPVIPPRNQFDWPLTPAAPQPINLRTWLSHPPGAAPVYLPSRVIDWGTWADPRTAQTWIAINPALLAPIKPPSSPSWALPVQPQFPISLRTIIESPLTFGRPPISANLSLPTAPVYPVSLRTWVETPQITAAIIGLPPNQYNWPLPLRAVQPALTWTSGPPGPAPIYMPSRVTDWGNVPAPQQSALTWLQSPQITVQIAQPVNQYDWKLPIAPVRAAYTWAQSPQITAQAVITPPPNQYYWPLPIQATRATLTWTSGPPGAAPIYMPSRVMDWGNVPDTRARALSWTQTPNFTPQASPRPPIQGLLDLPIQPIYPQSLRTFTNPGIELEYVFRAPYIAPKWQRPYFTYDLPLNVAVLSGPPPQKPQGAIVTALPAQAIRQAITWLQTPNFAVQANFIPSRVVDWGNTPAAPTPIAWLYQSNIALLTTVVGKPVANYDLSTPRTAQRGIDFFHQINRALLSSPKPVNQSDWPTPTPPARQAITWTRGPTPVIANGLKPFNQTDWPVPQPQPRLAITWLQTNAAILLTPPPLKPPLTLINSLPILATPRIYGFGYGVPNLIPPPVPELPNVEAPMIRYWWDKDEWGNLIPGAGFR